MKIHGIETTNFRLHADTQIALHDGITGIVGSNETGKSTLLEAVLWAIFGTKAIRKTKKSLRWHGAPERRGAAVMIEFEVGGTPYRIERGESNAKLYEVRSQKVLAEGTSAVDDYAPSLLGMSYEEFRASLLCGQKDLDRLVDNDVMGPTERQAFIRQVLGVGRIDEALTACRKRKNELAAEVQGTEAGLGERQPLLDAVDAAAAEVVESEDALSAKRKHLKSTEVSFTLADESKRESDRKSAVYQRLESEHEQAEKDRLGAENEIERLEERVEAIEKAKARITDAEPKLAELPGLKERRDQLREAKATASERKSLQKQIKALDELTESAHEIIEDAEKQIGFYDAEKHEAANQRAGEADKRLAELRDERSSKKADVEARMRAVDAECDRLRQKVERLREIGRDSRCPTCTRVLGEHFDDVVDTLTSKADELAAQEKELFAQAEALRNPSNEEIDAETEVEDAETEREKWVTFAKDAERAKDAIEREKVAIERMAQERTECTERLASLPGVAFDADELKDVESRIMVLENLDRGLVSARGLVAQEASTRAELTRWAEKQEEAGRRATEIEAEIDRLDFDQVKHGEIVGRHESWKEKLEDARMDVARSEETLKAKREAHARAQAAVDEYDRKAESLKESRHALRIHEKASTGLADFRTAIAGTIRPELEEIMSGFVHILTDGRHEAVTLNEDFTPVLLEEGIPTEVISGGTEDIAALAMRLAISQMIAERAGHPIECLVLDEPFGSMDEVRRGNVLNLIRRLGGVFDQVLVISHVAETRDAVDRVVELEYDAVAGKTVVVSSPAIREVA